MALTPGSRVVLDVERPVAGGRMLARHDGQVVFVSGAIPGERVAGVVERLARGTVFADTIEVLTPSPDRRRGIEGRCGGLLYSHIAYGRQVALKAAVIEDAWRRVARLTPPAPVVVMASPEQGYRLRARLHVAEGRIGFYHEGTHRICDASATGQLGGGAHHWLAHVAGQLSRRPSAGVVAIDLVENVEATERACHAEMRPGADAGEIDDLMGEVTGVSWQAGPHGTPRILHGVPGVVDRIRSAGAGSPWVVLQHDVRSFFQGNRYLIEPMVERVVREAHGDSVLDLYAGTGLFGLSVAAAGQASVVAVEGDAASGSDLEGNAAPYAARVQVEQQSVEAYVRRPRLGHGTWILDPPRTGLSAAVRDAILRDRPGRLVYVSCDVATLARDVSVLAQGGFEVTRLEGFDMFPSTGHVEAVCVLVAASSAAARKPRNSQSKSPVA